MVGHGARQRSQAAHRRHRVTQGIATVPPGCDHRIVRIRRPYVLGAAAAVAPLALLALLLASPEADDAWENRPAHFWLVLSTAAVCVGLGTAVGTAARRRRDSRTVLVALACITA